MATTEITERLRTAIRASNESLHQLSLKSGVDRGTLSRFMRDERTLTLPAVEKLCRTLGLKLVADKNPSGKPAMPGTPSAGELMAEENTGHPKKDMGKPTGKRSR